VETAAVQQVESSAVRHWLVASYPTRGLGPHQSNHSVHSPLLLSSMGQEATAAPQPDLACSPHRPPMHEWLRPNLDAHSIINNRCHTWHDDDVHRVAARADGTGPDLTIEEYGDTHPGMVANQTTGAPAWMLGAMGLWSSHTESVVPTALPTAHQCR